MSLTTDPVVARGGGRRKHSALGTKMWRVRHSPSRKVTSSNRLETSDQLRVAARRWGRPYARRLWRTDFLAVLVAAAFVLTVRLPAVGASSADEHLSIGYLGLTAGLLASWMMALTWSGSRDTKSIGYGAMEYRRIVHSTFAVFGGVAILSYLFKLELSRGYLLVMMPVGFTAIFLGRWCWRRWLAKQRVRGQCLSRVLAVGNVHTVTELLRDLRRMPQAGYEVIGVCLSPTSRASGAAGTELLDIDGVPVLGSLDNVAEMARKSGADIVAVTSTASFGPSRVRKLSWELEDTDAELILAPALTNIAGPRIHTQPVAGLPLIHVARPTYRGANKILKKSFDGVGSLALILLFSPVLLSVAIAIKVSSRGPVFFRQERVGINGKIFRMIKFRSMVIDAESRLEVLRQDQRDAGNAILFKMKNDPRVTTVGKLIRRFSIDELPQLFNVVIGDMSLVGPRPPLKAEVDLLEDEARRRLLVKPGITGLWQVSGRSDLTWDDTVRLDVYYVENWSITGDMVIIGKTLRAVVSSAGAY